MMTTDLEEYQRLQKLVEETNRTISQAEGELKALRRDLKAEFQVDSLSSAERKLAELEKEKTELESMFSNELIEFKQKWGDRLGP